MQLRNKCAGLCW